MRVRIATILVAACGGVLMPAASMHSQAAPYSRSAAIAAALDRGARLGVARADTAVASAALIAARVFPNPTLNATYSKSLPTWHFTADVPIDFPMLRQLRIRAAQVGVQAAQLRYRFARASIALDADTTYTHAIAAREKLALSRRNALDADSLLHMVERRRDAGDAAEMDVELARVNAGQQANAAAADSLTWISALLDLQAVLGIASEQLQVNATDSLAAPPASSTGGPVTLTEAAANLSLESAQLSERLARRSMWSLFSISGGIETGDPSQPGILPTVGVGIGLPLFDRNRGAIAQAQAERIRAQAEVTLAQVEARNQIAHALRERANALARVERDRNVVASAERVTAMSIEAYREGAQSLPIVLQAQRSARDVISQYIDDLAAAWIATAELRVFSLTSATQFP